MNIRELIDPKSTTVASLKPYNMFVLIYQSSPKILYMYIMTYNGPKYLELHNGAWRESGTSFLVTDEISIISVEDLVYSKL